MKRTRRTTRIELVTERVFTLRARTAEAGPTAWCPSCGGARTLVTLPEAAALAGLGERAVCRRVEAHVIHFDEAVDGRLLICLDSLLRHIDEGKEGLTT